jgi:YVTN family beta-propeller protein
MPYVLGPTVTVGTNPIGVAFGSGSLWVANLGSGTVSRIDPATLSVTATITLASAKHVVYAFGSLWVHNGNNVSRIDPSTNTITATIVVGSDTYDLTADSTHVWVAVRLAQFVRRIDPTTNTVTASIPASYPLSVATGFGSIWIGTSNYTIDRYDASTLGFTASIALSLTEDATALHCAFGRVWATTNQLTSPRFSMREIDPASNTIVSTNRTGSGTGNDITDDGSGIWYTHSSLASLRRWDPVTNTRTDTLVVTFAPQGCTVDDDNKVWFAHGTVCQRVDFLPDPVGWVRGHAWG